MKKTPFLQQIENMKTHNVGLWIKNCMIYDQAQLPFNEDSRQCGDVLCMRSFNNC